MSSTTNSHSETNHLFKKRKIFVSLMSFNISKNDVQQNKQLQSLINNSNLTARLSNQQQFVEVTLDLNTLKQIFQINNENIEHLLNTVSVQHSDLKEKQKFSEFEHYENKSKKKYHE